MRTIVLSLLFGAALSTDLSAQGLQLSPGVYWVTTGAPNVVLNNSGIINNGVFIPGASTLIFSGNDASLVSYIGGDRKISLYNVVIAMASPGLRLDNDAQVDNFITLDSGNLELNGHLLDLGSTGSIIGERDGACITGSSGGMIRRTADLFAPQAVNPGNIGIAISSPDIFGPVTITRGHTAQLTANGVAAIQRYFVFDPAINGSRSTVRIYYLDGELGGNSKPELTLFSASGAWTDWQEVGASHRSTDSNWVEQSQLKQLQRFSLAMGDAVAAGELAEAYPNPVQDVVKIKLVTPAGKDALIGLYDVSGHLLELRQVHCTAGTSFTEWNLSRYAAGVYYLRFRGLTTADLKLVRQ
ncbi:MAG TPA: T9SS type A sorting domain-containing protein [Puia sp.]|jgi:hypothetical protein|nr:T9SS type A sorting domain-containing protein [Puia sp.]